MAIPDSYFEGLYGSNDDPWGLATSRYEARKYELTVASLPNHRYRWAFEPGCSVGVLTLALASRCDRLWACDFQPSAVAAAQQRCKSSPHVTVDRRRVPQDWPSGPFDLLVLSEICYYFDPVGLARMLNVAMSTLECGATVIAVHWRGQTDYPLTGDQANQAVDATPGLVAAVHHEEPEFVLDVWRWGAPPTDEGWPAMHPTRSKT